MDLDVNTWTLPEQPKLSGQSHMLLAVPPNVCTIIISPRREFPETSHSPPENHCERNISTGITRGIKGQA